jgi:hypothetical protein
MALTRLQQLCLRQESSEGVYTDPFAATYAKYLAVDPQMTFEVETYQRDIARASFTPLAPLAGAVLGQCSFSLEAASTGTTITGVPNFDVPLRACNFRRELVHRLTIGAIGGSGTFLHGETVSQASSGATGIVIGNTVNGETYLYISQANGLGTATFNAINLITGATSGATATPTAYNADYAFGYWPISQPLHNLTFASAVTSGSIVAGDTIRGVTSGAIAIAAVDATTALGTTQTLHVRRVLGTFQANESVTLNGSAFATALINNAAQAFSSVDSAAPLATKIPVAPSISIGLCKDGVRESLYNCRGNVTISGNIGEPLIFAFTFSGIKNAVADAGNISGVTYSDRLPPVLLGATMRVGDPGISTVGAERTLCATSLSVEMGNDIQYRRCMNAATGIDGIYINGRNPTGSFDPELQPEADFDYMNNYFTTGNVRMQMDVGSTTADKFRIKLHNMAISSVGQGDRNGIITRDVGFNLHSGSGTSVSGDNEMVIIWSHNATF